MCIKGICLRTSEGMIGPPASEAISLRGMIGPPAQTRVKGKERIFTGKIDSNI